MLNKTALITGASSGIGAACAEIFAKNGARLILAARRKNKLTELANQLHNKYKTSSLLLTLDVSNQAEVVDAINSLPTDWKNIDVLINAAGLALGRDIFQETNFDDITTVLNTNVNGLFYVTRAVLPLMLARQKGHIINLGSIAGHESYSGGSIYCATKAAVKMFSDVLKKDLLGTPLRVTEIDPGMVETEFSVVRFKGDQDSANKVYANMTPLTPGDIADAIFYCVSRPPHVNVMQMILYPTDQSGATLVHRKN